MSSMLEQAIVDAKTLREAALKNAEQAIIEQYAPQIKQAVESLLEEDTASINIGDKVKYEGRIYEVSVGLNEEGQIGINERGGGGDLAARALRPAPGTGHAPSPLLFRLLRDVVVLGAFLMGMLAGYLLSHGVTTDMRAFVVIGLLGAFTTFSTFSLDAVVLLQRGDITAAVLYIGGSVILGILSILAGMYLTKGLGVV